jgi:hypothetical protein
MISLLFSKLPKRLLFEIVVICTLLLAVFILFKGYQREKSERMRFESNQAVLLAQIHSYKVSDSLNAARVDALTLTVDEFRKNFKEQASLIKEMGVKLNRVLSYTSLATETTNNITTMVRDSLVLREVPVPMQVIQYSDKWISLDGYIEEREFHGRVTTRDSIEQVVHRVPRKFLFIKYGTKGIRQDIVSKNPNTEISYLRYIEFGKRKRGR